MCAREKLPLSSYLPKFMLFLLLFKGVSYTVVYTLIFYIIVLYHMTAIAYFILHVHVLNYERVL